MPNDLQTACDPDRIEAFLLQQLSAAEQTGFEAHLDECQNCRERLEVSAASEELWEGVRESLSSQPFSTDLNDSAAGDQTVFSHQTILDWLAPTDDDRMLGRLDGYEVMGVVGSGGMGVVLKALDPALNRYVAIKVLAPHLGSSGSARRRFSREARASAAVVHENVIEIHGVSEKDGLPYLVMPYVSGPSLQRRLDNDGPLELAEILRIGRQAARALAVAHSQGLIHRDVKPANILLEQGIERVKLTDFGLARAADDASLTKSGVIAGTPQYMSPQQARGESIDQRSDLFSLGSVLYAMSTGRAPFRAETPYGVLRRITDDEPRPIREINPDIPTWLCQIISKLMSKDAGDRYQSAQEVAELLEHCLAHVQQPTVVPLPESLVPQTSGSRLFSFSRLTWTGLGITGFAILALLLWPKAAPPDISGKWTGEGWGQVTLKPAGQGKYSGTYTDTFGINDGQIELKWSRVDQRYRGTWGEGKRRFGKISVELKNGKVRGFWTASDKSEIEPGDPEVEDLIWVRPEDSAAAERVPGIQVKLLLNAESHSLDLMRKNEGSIGHSINATGLKGTIDGKQYDNLTAVIAHRCRLESFKEKSVDGRKYWEATFFVPQGPKDDGSNQSLTQQRIDELTKQGVEFQLDHYREQIPWRFDPPDSDRIEGDDSIPSALDQYKRLIERRRYEEAVAAALKAKELAAEEDAQQLWEMRSNFAQQLEKARDDSDEEQKLLELMNFPLQRIADAFNAHTASPPQPVEVVAAVERSEKLPESSLTDLFKQHPDNIRIIVEPVYDKVGQPRFYPLVGVARLHRVRFKCTLYFLETDDLKWPGADKGKGTIEKTVLIDHDHLIAVAGESKPSQPSDGEQAVSKPQNENVPEAPVPLFGQREENEPDDELQFLLLWPRGSKMAELDGQAKLELPGRLRMRGNRIFFSLKDLPKLPKTTLYGSFNRVPLNEKTKQFLNEHAISLEVSDDDLRLASYGTLTKYVFLPHQQPGEKWAGHFAVLTMGRVDVKTDEGVRKNLKRNGGLLNGDLLVVVQLSNHPLKGEAGSYELAPTPKNNGTEPFPRTEPPSEQTPATKSPGKELKLSFQRAPYTEVINLLGKHFGFAVQFDAIPQGTLSYHEEEPVSLSDAIKSLNGFLATQQLELVREDDRLRVRKASDSSDENANSSAAFGPVIERTIPYHHAIDFLSGRISEWPARWRNTMSTGEIPEERQGSSIQALPPRRSTGN